MPLSHPTDYLQAYAAGQTSEAVSLIIATHLAMCPSCRDELDAYEAIGGALLKEAGEVDVADSAFDSVMAAIGSAPEAHDQAPALNKDVRKAMEAGDIVLPKPLRDYLPAASLRDLEELKWSRLPNFAELNLELEGEEAKTSLLKIAAGTKMPKHTHEGTELTLVLQGGFSDSTGHYGVGDLAIADGGVDHSPKADDGVDCICLAVTDAGLKLTGPIGRFLNPFVSL